MSIAHKLGKLSWYIFEMDQGSDILTTKTLADILGWELAHVGSVLAVDVLSVRVLSTCLADVHRQIRSRAYVIETSKIC